MYRPENNYNGGRESRNGYREYVLQELVDMDTEMLYNASLYFLNTVYVIELFCQDALMIKLPSL